MATTGNSRQQQATAGNNRQQQATVQLQSSGGDEQRDLKWEFLTGLVLCSTGWEPTTMISPFKDSAPDSLCQTRKGCKYNSFLLHSLLTPLIGRFRLDAHLPTQILKASDNAYLGHLIR
jgi:hypothetical protein